MGKIFALKTTKETLKDNEKEIYHNLELENSLRCQFSALMLVWLWANTTTVTVSPRHTTITSNCRRASWSPNGFPQNLL